MRQTSRGGLVEKEAAERETSRGLLAVLVGLAFLMNTIARGVTETFAVLLLPVEQGLGASRAEIAACYSIFMLAYGIAAPFAGQVIDRLGARTSYGAGLTILGLGYVLAGSAEVPWQYYLGVGLCGGLGAALLGMVAASSLLSRWFTRRIGSIIAIPYAAVGAGMLLLPPLTQILLQTFDWRAVHRILGLGVLALLPLLIALPLRRISAGSRQWQEARRIAAASPAGLWTLGAAVRTGAFWAIFGVYFWTSMAAYAVLPHSVAYLIEQGFDPLLAAGAFGLTGMLSVVGIVGIGWLSDRIGRRRAATLSYISTILGIALLITIARWPLAVLLYGFVLFFGIMQGARGPIIVALIAKLFPGGAVGSIFGMLSIAMGLGAGAGSWLSGLLHEATGSYVAAFSVAIIASAIGLSLFWVTRSLREERMPELVRSGP